jgi:hypothetical protein
MAVKGGFFKVFENKKQSKIFELKRDEVNGNNE